MWRYYVRSGFVKALQRYVPALADADILPGGCGVRAQAVAIDGTIVDDFSVSTLGRTLHVVNAPSPAATSSLAIGAWKADRAEAELGVGISKKPRLCGKPPMSASPPRRDGTACSGQVTGIIDIDS